jgi:hypothetical protein
VSLREPSTRDALELSAFTNPGRQRQQQIQRSPHAGALLEAFAGVHVASRGPWGARHSHARVTADASLLAHAPRAIRAATARGPA